MASEGFCFSHIYLLLSHNIAQVFSKNWFESRTFRAISELAFSVGNPRNLELVHAARGGWVCRAAPAVDHCQLALRCGPRAE